MEKIFSDKELKDWFLKFCKDNKGCYVITEEEKEEQDYQREYIMELLDELEVYGYVGDNYDEGLVSLDDVKKLISKIFKI